MNPAVEEALRQGRWGEIVTIEVAGEVVLEMMTKRMMRRRRRRPLYP